MQKIFQKVTQLVRYLFTVKVSSSPVKLDRRHYVLGIVADVVLLVVIFSLFRQPISHFLSPMGKDLTPLTQSKGQYEVFGFAPYWSLKNMHSVNFEVLTTLAYFGVDVDAEGNLDREGTGYRTFMSERATNLFKRAHANGTRVVLTFTQMDEDTILAFLDNPDGQKKMIDQVVEEVKNRGIDGANIDFEFGSNAGQEYRDKFSLFIQNLTQQLHQEVPGSKVSVSVYASAVKSPKIYDIHALGQQDIQIFMMAYDFGYRGSDQAIPTSPLYGHKEGKYWYDVSTAVEDFIAIMPADKLILGTAWYGYNYPIYGEPKIKADIRPSWTWRGASHAQTYAVATNTVTADMDGISAYREGWDDIGKVAWKAYYLEATDTWRMIFLDDVRSLALKYSFAKEKKLGGVGMWALGFEENKSEFWNLLSTEFGSKYARAEVALRQIH